MDEFITSINTSKRFVPQVHNPNAIFTFSDRQNSIPDKKEEIFIETHDVDYWTSEILKLTKNIGNFSNLSESFQEIRIIPDGDGVKAIFIRSENADGIDIKIVSIVSTLTYKEDKNCIIL